jgi:hypothetical protein
MDQATTIWISQALVIFMFVGLIAVYAERLYTKKGIGARTIQITGVLLVVPLIGILALHGILEKQTTATLLGALTGYLLSGVGSYEPPKSKPKTKPNTGDKNA